MIQDFGGLPVQIGEAEIEQTTGRASGRFIPGPGYAIVRDVFLLRNHGDRSAYLDARDRLWPQLYHDGVPMAAGDLHIDDPDRTEADLDNWEPIEGPTVGSRGELATAMQFRVPPVVAVLTSATWCTRCRGAGSRHARCSTARRAVKGGP